MDLPALIIFGVLVVAGYAVVGGAIQARTVTSAKAEGGAAGDESRDARRHRRSVLTWKILGAVAVVGVLLRPVEKVLSRALAPEWVVDGILFSGSALGLQAMLLGILLVAAAAWVALIKLNAATITGSNDASRRRRISTVVLVGVGTVPALAIGLVSGTLQFLIP